MCGKCPEIRQKISLSSKYSSNNHQSSNNHHQQSWKSSASPPWKSSSSVALVPCHCLGPLPKCLLPGGLVKVAMTGAFSLQIPWASSASAKGEWFETLGFLPNGPKESSGFFDTTPKTNISYPSRHLWVDGGHMIQAGYRYQLVGGCAILKDT